MFRLPRVLSLKERHAVLHPSVEQSPERGLACLHSECSLPGGGAGGGVLLLFREGPGAAMHLTHRHRCRGYSRRPSYGSLLEASEPSPGSAAARRHGPIPPSIRSPRDRIFIHQPPRFSDKEEVPGSSPGSPIDWGLHRIHCARCFRAGSTCSCITRAHLVRPTPTRPGGTRCTVGGLAKIQAGRLTANLTSI